MPGNVPFSGSGVIVPGCRGCGNAGGCGLGQRIELAVAWGRCGQFRRGWSRRRIASEPERTQIRFREIQHTDDVRRQRQDDVGLVDLFAVVGEEPSDDRQVAEARSPVMTVRSSSRISPASMLVSPSFSRIVVEISRLPKVGRLFSEPEMLLNVTFSASETSSSWWVRGVMSMLTPIVLVDVRRDRLLVDAAGGDRRERRHRNRHALAESRLRRDAFGRAQLRVGQRPGRLSFLSRR